MEEQNLNTIGLRVDDKTMKQAKALAEKEQWSLGTVARVALEKYLKLRGYKNED